MSAQGRQTRACTLDVLDLTGCEVTDADRERLAEYLAGFVDVRDDGYDDTAIRCPGCETPRAITPMALMCGIGYQWGVVHGELMCAECGWSARADHSVPLDSGQFLRWQMVMPTMPAAATEHSS